MANSNSSEECSSVEEQERIRQRRITAYHEAGHAVMAILLGRNVHRVSIIPKQTRLGNCELRKDVAKVVKDPLEADALILLSGMVGESKVTGRYELKGASSDLAQVNRLAIMRGGNEDAVQRIAKRWLDKAEHLLGQPANEAAIAAIAGQLLEREKISGRNAVHHFKEALLRSIRD